MTSDSNVYPTKDTTMSVTLIKTPRVSLIKRDTSDQRKIFVTPRINTVKAGR